jgi:hypothetical protein
MRKLLVELLRYIWLERKLWLVPVVIVLMLFALLVVVALKGGVAAPFIYPLF